jgi:hypothetical protein
MKVELWCQQRGIQRRGTGTVTEILDVGEYRLTTEDGETFHVKNNGGGIWTILSLGR